jgi:hypothetical protein
LERPAPAQLTQQHHSEVERRLQVVSEFAFPLARNSRAAHAVHKLVQQWMRFVPPEGEHPKDHQLRPKLTKVHCKGLNATERAVGGVASSADAVASTSAAYKPPPPPPPPPLFNRNNSGRMMQGPPRPPPPPPPGSARGNGVFHPGHAHPPAPQEGGARAGRGGRWGPAADSFGSAGPATQRGGRGTGQRGGARTQAPQHGVVRGRGGRGRPGAGRQSSDGVEQASAGAASVSSNHFSNSEGGSRYNSAARGGRAKHGGRRKGQGPAQPVGEAGADADRSGLRCPLLAAPAGASDPQAGMSGPGPVCRATLLAGRAGTEPALDLASRGVGGRCRRRPGVCAAQGSSKPVCEAHEGDSSSPELAPGAADAGPTAYDDLAHDAAHVAAPADEQLHDEEAPSTPTRGAAPRELQAAASFSMSMASELSPTQAATTAADVAFTALPGSAGLFAATTTSAPGAHEAQAQCEHGRTAAESFSAAAHSFDASDPELHRNFRAPSSAEAALDAALARLSLSRPLFQSNAQAADAAAAAGRPSEAHASEAVGRCSPDDAGALSSQHAHALKALLEGSLQVCSLTCL